MGDGMKRAWFAAVFGWVAIAFATPSYAGPAVATRYQKAAMAQEACLARAEAAIRNSNLDKLERTEQSRYGQQREYTGVVRCVTENGIVLFIGSGPARDIADKLAGALFHHWTESK